MRIGFLFAGQGAQKAGMGYSFYQKYPFVKKIYDEQNLSFDIKNLCFFGPQDSLNQTVYAQPCILLTSCAIAEVLKSKGIVPEMVAGLSLGEYSALCYAKTFLLSEALEIVAERGKIMQEALPQGTTTMAAVLNTDVVIIEEVCKEVSKFGVCEIANYNCPGQIVITGEVEAVQEAEKLLLEKGARRVIPLTVSGAFHSSLLEEASLKLRNVLETHTISTPKIPVVYNYTGKISSENVSDILVNQIKSSVYFMQSVEYMIVQGIDTFIEIGPGTTLKGFVKKINPDVRVFSVEDEESLEKMMGEL